MDKPQDSMGKAQGKAQDSAQSKKVWHTGHGEQWEDQIEHRALENARKAHRKRDAEQWREVDGLIEREAAHRAKAGPRNFGAPVPWDGVDPGPERF